MTVIVGIVCYVVEAWCGIIAVAMGNAAKERDRLLGEGEENEQSKV